MFLPWGTGGNWFVGKYLKTDSDGRTVFFPWGYLGPGYVIASDEERQRLSRHLNILFRLAIFVWAPVFAVTLFLAGPVGAIAIGVLALILYAVWAIVVTRRM